MNEQTTLRRALLTIKKLKQLLQDQLKPEPIAIVGLACRFPHAANKEAYWQLLSEGRNCISSLPEERWRMLNNTQGDKNNPYWGSYLTDIANFDAYFFGISPREALRMDPQQRLLLEVTYEAIEDAGISTEALAGSNTGVFTCLYPSQLAHLQTLETDLDALYLPTGTAASIAANRISYLFDLRGPSIVLDTACSSSLVAMHLATLHLQNKLCDLAFVSGAHLNILPSIHDVLSKAKMLSPDGQCKTFDANANGYVQGEGIGTIVLKPLTVALKNKDRIYAVIMGSAINQDGKTNGLTAPNGLQQEAVLKSAYAAAHIAPHEISYVECHGTGTFLGDPIEIQALGEVISKSRDKETPCFIGSVKTNIGHLEPAAGMASIIKVALALQHAQIPPHLNFTTANPHIAFDKYHFQIPQQLKHWPKYGDYRIAGVSGFGFGGTNGHIVVRELSEQEKPITEIVAQKEELFVLSAKDPKALSELMNKVCSFLDKNLTLDLALLCYNTHVRRSHYFYRLAIIASSTLDLYHLLKKALENPANHLNSIFITNEKNKSPHSLNPSILYDETDLSTLAERYVNHAHINWKQYEKNRSYTHVDFPSYPWQHKAYWPPLENKQLLQATNSLNHYPLQAKPIFSPLDNLQFEFVFNTKSMPEIKDTYHVLHAGYYLEMLAFAVDQLYQQVAFSILDLNFLLALFVPDHVNVTVQLILDKQEDGSLLFTFFSQLPDQTKWAEHAKGKLLLETADHKKVDDITGIQQRCTLAEEGDALYQRVIAMGMPAGNSIRWTHQYWLGEKEIFCDLKQPASITQNDIFKLGIHPGVIDGCIQPLFKLLPKEFLNPYIALSIKKISFLGMQEGPLHLLGSLNHISASGDKLSGSCFLINKDSKIIAEFENIFLTRLDNKIQTAVIIDEDVINLSSLPIKERESFIKGFLIKQIATILSMPKEDVDINRTLRDMGLDSLMALALLKTIESGLGVSYTMQAILEDPTIDQMTAFLLNQNDKHEREDTASSHNAWIPHRHKPLNAKVRLFCFPYGGTGASTYRDWHRHFPSHIDVCPVQLPGREERMDIKPIKDINILVDALIENLQSEFDIPFAFFGHSFGSLISFELARQLRRRNLPQPSHLFVSAFPDPRIPAKNLNNLLQEAYAINIDLLELDEPSIANLSHKQLSQLSTIFNNNGIVEYGEHLLNKEIVKVLLPIFVGDMSIVKNYHYQHEQPLDFPMTVFLGKKDAWIAYEDHLTWVDHTQKSCEIHELNGGHLFIKDDPIKKMVFKKIIERLF